MKHGLHVFAVATALAIGASAVPALVAQERSTTTRTTEDHPEYRNNNSEHRNNNPDYRDNNSDYRNNSEYRNNDYYRLGNREGYEDYGRKERRKEHEHKYRRDEDRRAHDYGYEQGWNGHRYDSDDHPR